MGESVKIDHCNIANPDIIFADLPGVLIEIEHTRTTREEYYGGYIYGRPQPNWISVGIHYSTDNYASEAQLRITLRRWLINKVCCEPAFGEKPLGEHTSTKKIGVL